MSHLDGLSKNIDEQTVNVLGVLIDKCDMQALNDRLKAHILASNKALAISVNVHFLTLGFQHKWMRELANNAEIVFCDGFGVRLGAAILGQSLPPRITLADYIWELAQFCVENDFSLYFIGAKPGVTQEAAQRIQMTFPSVRILGVHHGYFVKDKEHNENLQVIAAINAVKPDILVIGLGMPLQEAWLRDNWHRLDVKVALTSGAVFDYVSGNLRRAPKWMTDNGLEWLGRMLIEPRRLWKRYLIGNTLFLIRISMQRFALLRFDDTKRQ